MSSGGTLSGTPTTNGTFNFRITATGFGSCTGFRDYTVTINCPTITVNPATLPNGDAAADFNGSSQYVSVPSAAVFSIPTTHSLTWEAWIRPDVLEFPNNTGG